LTDLGYRFGTHICIKHNCEYWDKCPLCLLEDKAINPSMRSQSGLKELQSSTLSKEEIEAKIIMEDFKKNVSEIETIIKNEKFKKQYRNDLK
jgi:hypothetical protein